MSKKKLVRTASVSSSLDILLKGQLFFLNEHFDVIAISGQDFHLENIANREKVRTISVVFSRRISPIQDLISLYKLYRVLKKEKPFIIHSITPKAGLLSMIAGYFAEIPYRIHTFTGLVFPSKKGLSKSFFIFMDRILCRFATHIFPEGNGVKNDLIQYKITSKPLNIIANGNINGVDLEWFNSDLFSENDKNELRKKLNILDVDFVFVFVGRLVTDKGINELIKAFENLSKTNKNVKLLLVGDFEDKIDALLPETKLLIGNNKNIIFVGFQVDVRLFLAISNTFVLPSYREGFPNVLLQAGAMNLPCIVTNVNGCNEIINDNFNGKIIEPKSENEILNAMQLFLDNKDMVKDFASNSRENIAKKYNQSQVWNALLMEYSKLK